MAWRKSPSELIERFYAALPDGPLVERRKMFGYPCAFVNGNMFTGLHQENLIVRIGEQERDEAVAKGTGDVFEPMPGRVMREYLSLSPSAIADARRLNAAVRKAFEYTVALPAKANKPRKRK